MRRHRLAVQASVATMGGVQAAVVGIAVTDRFEIVFDTLETTRKAGNLARDGRIALVIGGLLDGEEQTVQYEGFADRPAGSELQSLQETYFRVFPDGRERLKWPGLIHLRIKPQWLRFSDYLTDPPTIIEMDRAQIENLR